MSNTPATIQRLGEELYLNNVRQEFYQGAAKADFNALLVNFFFLLEPGKIYTGKEFLQLLEDYMGAHIEPDDDEAYERVKHAVATVMGVL